MRIVHLLVICALLFAAGHVYRIKMESTVRTERVAQLHAAIRTERDAIASLHAQWAELDSPMRIQGLVERHLKLQSVQTTQFDDLKNLPDRPPSFAMPGAPDPIGSMIESIDHDIQLDPPATASVSGAQQ
jgi:hypothetical protein